MFLHPFARAIPYIHTYSTHSLGVHLFFITTYNYLDHIPGRVGIGYHFSKTTGIVHLISSRYRPHSAGANGGGGGGVGAHENSARARWTIPTLALVFRTACAPRFSDRLRGRGKFTSDTIERPADGRQRPIHLYRPTSTSGSGCQMTLSAEG